ncbi:hypothetical protein MH1LPH_01210 [Lactiplantibacillus brownii]
MLERGGHVCEPKYGLTSRAFPKLEDSPAKENFTTEHHPAHPALVSNPNINWILKILRLPDTLGTTTI